MKNFSELKLSPPLMKAITELGYETPTPIQAAALPILLGESTDFLGLAATGTGKTATFGIPLLSRLDSATRAVQALVLCPTRELAVQVCGQITLMGKHLGVRALPVYGGASYGDQISGLRRGATVVVGTPGRVVDLIARGVLELQDVHTVVLDEADKMISMGFKEELEKILEQAPRETSNIWFFSATMSRDVRKVADEYLRNPQQVQVNQKEMLSSTVEQSYYATQESNKPEVLCKLIDVAVGFYGVVFCQTKSLVHDLTQYMQGRGYRVDCLHGDMDQNARTRVMQAFRDRKINILICTDVASRGLDVQGITHVINYSIPRELDHYVHRIGRTARSGKTGFAMSLVTPSHRGLLRRIEQLTKSRITEGKIPGRREIGAKKVAEVLQSFDSQTQHARAVELMSAEWKERMATLSVEEVAGRFLSMMFPEVFGERGQELPSVKARVPSVQGHVQAKIVRNPVMPSARSERSEDARLPVIRTGSLPKPRVTPIETSFRSESPSESRPRVMPKPLKREQFKREKTKHVQPRGPVREEMAESLSDFPELREKTPARETRKERRARLFGHLRFDPTDQAAGSRSDGPIQLDSLIDP